MDQVDLGQRIYKSTAPVPVKVLIVLAMVASIANLFISTLSDPKFILLSKEQGVSLFSFYLTHPDDFLALLLLFVAPGIYYGFIRGIQFYEKGIVLNRGLPFFNRIIPYELILNYSIVHPRYWLSIQRKDNHDEILFTVSRMDRAIAILDQHLVREDTHRQDLVSSTKSANKKLLWVIVLFSVTIFLLQHLGLFRFYN